MLELNDKLLEERLDPGRFGASGRGGRQRPYIADESLSTAAALSILLCQPLLLSGIPGVGKTGAAYYVAATALKVKRDPIRLTVTTQTSGRDLLYRFDALARFHDKETSPLRTFLRFEALGRAIVEACGGTAHVLDVATDKPIVDPKRIEHITGAAPSEGEFLKVKDLLQPNEPLPDSPQTSVVLIDEIDKAPRDTPNDLLESFEAMRFSIDELGLKIGVEFGEAERLDAYPIVICTTNAENSLPDAFLRRCVFHEIAMPSKTELKRIIAAHLQELERVDESKAVRLADAVYEAGSKISEQIGGVSRPPGTAEFIALARAFLAARIEPDEIRDALGAKRKLDRATAKAILGVIVKTSDDLQKALPMLAGAAAAT